MPVKPLRGNALRNAPKCPDCGERLRKPRPEFKTCPRCTERLPSSMFGHHANRAGHLTVYCRACRFALDRTRLTGHLTGHAGSGKTKGDDPSSPFSVPSAPIALSAMS